MRNSKVLIFKNMMVSEEGKGQQQQFSCGTHYLASALKKEKIQVIFSDSKICVNGKGFITDKEVLEKILLENQDINFIIISLSEFYFEQARKLIKFLRKKSRAFIGVGGIMPTLTPKHAHVHLPEINFLITGMGEKVLPELINILEGKDIYSRLTSEDLKKLSHLRGFLFSTKGIFIERELDYKNKIKDYDNSALDFSFFNKENFTDGAFLFTSWGCLNNCLFCTGMIKKKFIAKSLNGLKKIVEDYHLALREKFAGQIPESAFSLSFYDDDFLADPERAIGFFNYLKKTPFRINFFQTGINSFFKKRNAKSTDILNQRLLSELTPDIFNLKKDVNIYIGLENTCDEELKRLGKGYDSKRAEKLIEALASRKIKVAYHFIASNQLTTVDNVLENLFKFSVLQARYGERFKILTPIIPHLISLFPSSSYRISTQNNRNKFLNINRILSSRNNLKYDYPLIANDIPIDKSVREIMPILYNQFLGEKNYYKILDEILFNLLCFERGHPHKKDIHQVIEKYENYPDLIRRQNGRQALSERDNLQIMVTRRCHLRCKYCPIIKKDEDIDEEVLYGAIDLLFTVSRDGLRLDFTGGEPLLRFDLVVKAVEYAKKLAKEKNKKISFYLVTNLIALTDEIADFLAKENFFLELSVDGEEKWHNLYKVGEKPELNAYCSTILNLKKIFSRKIKNYAVMVVTPATSGYLFKNFNHLLKLGFKDIGINYALCSMWQEREKREFFQQLDLIKKRFQSFIQNGAIRLSNLESRVEPAILNSEIMIDTDGTVHLLTDWLFEREILNNIPSLGNVRDLKNFKEVYISRFRILSRLLQYHSRQQVREVIFNNIEMGNSVKDAFEKWKKK